MHQTFSWNEKIRQFMVVLIPILVTQVSMYAMSFFGTMMAGHAGAGDLAGVAIGVNIWMPVYTGFMGVLIAVTPLVAQLLGAKRKAEIPAVVTQALYLAVAIGVTIVLAGLVLVDPLLSLMRLEPAVREIARNYLIGVSFGVVPFFVFTVLRCFIDTLGYTRITMLIFLTALPLNAALSYALIFGVAGFPCLGGAGAGYASAMTGWFICGVAWLVARYRQPFKEYGALEHFQAVDFKAWWEQLRIGVPIGVAIFCETSIFAVVGLMMTRYSTATIAAHQAAINFASMLYMLPLSISMALTIAVGFEVGAQRFRDARHYAYLGLGTAVTAAGLFAVGLIAGEKAVAGLYTRDGEVMRLIGAFLAYAVFFQLSDAVATPIQGILRGYKDVNISLAVAMVSYWAIGLPTGYVLAELFGLGAFGYWIGLITGLAVGAALLSARLRQVQLQTGRGTASLEEAAQNG